MLLIRIKGSDKSQRMEIAKKINADRKIIEDDEETSIFVSGRKEESDDIKVSFEMGFNRDTKKFYKLIKRLIEALGS